MQMVWLSSKTKVPRTMVDAVDRERLYELLRYDESKKVTIVRAPAGYGKTTLLSQWFTQSNEPVAWLSLDEADNDPIRFWKYVVHMVSSISQSNIAQELSSLFNSQEASSLEFLIDSFLNELSLTSSSINIVMDDYHLIENDTIHQMIIQFIEYLPDNVQVYLTSRTVLPLPIAKWRVKSWLKEISTEQLRFTHEETQQFYENKNLHFNDDKLLQHVLKMTEGWATGIQLAGLSINTSQTVDIMDSAHPFITEFLLQEILNTLPPSTQDFLLHTSLLHSLEPAVCDKLTNRSDSYSVLLELEKKGLFIVRLNSNQPVFRYHHLFAEALQIELKKRYSQEMVSSIVIETATLLQDKGDFIAAIEILLNEQANELAESWITTHLVDIFTSGQTSTYVRWVQTLRNNHYSVSFEVLVMYIITLISVQQMEEAGKLIFELEHRQVTEKWMDAEENQGIASIFETVRAYAIIAIGDDIEKATEIIQRQLENGRVSSRWDNIPMQYNLFEHKILRTSIGSKGKFWPLEKAIPFAKLFRETELKDQNMTAFSYGASAETLYEKNYLEVAVVELEIALQYGHSYNDPGLFIPMYILKAHIHAMNSNFVVAHALLDSTIDIVKEKHWINSLRTMKARCYLLEGDILQAETELCKAESRHPFWLLVNARLLLAKGNAEEALKATIQVKTKALQEMQVSTIIEAAVLEAICEMELDHEDAAMMALHEALGHGAPYGYVRTFLDEKAIIPLLKTYLNVQQTNKNLHWNFVPASYLEQLIAQEPTQGSLLDSLTPREREVFRLLVDGATNREIANRLFLTEGTIRVYLTTIYSKLGVNSRAKAVLIK
ncbi:LuxR C-terminal-related transcriptional regulator [Psychrobacillus vulpis]|nr:LuxR C-terminal-related transcriptional regulator [Psychrobacillus vulpis]